MALHSLQALVDLVTVCPSSIVSRYGPFPHCNPATLAGSDLPKGCKLGVCIYRSLSPEGSPTPTFTVSSHSCLLSSFWPHLTVTSSERPSPSTLSFSSLSCAILIQLVSSFATYDHLQEFICSDLNAITRTDESSMKAGILSVFLANASLGTDTWKTLN